MINKLKIIGCCIVGALSFFSFSQDEKRKLFELWKNEELADTTRADALNKLIFKHYINTKPDSAYILNKSLEIFIFNKNLKQREGDIFLNNGLIESMIGSQDQSIINYNKALDIYNKYNDKIGLITTKINLGRTYKYNWDIETALEYFESSLEISESINDSLQISTSLTNIGNAYFMIYKFDKAIPYFEKSISISDKIGDKRGSLISKGNLANIFLKSKKVEEGLELITNVISEAENEGFIDIKITGLQILAGQYITFKDYKRAIKYGNECLELALEENDKISEKNCYMLLYKAYEDLGDYKMANSYLLKNMTSFESYEDIKARQKLQRLEISRVRSEDSLINVANTYKRELTYQKEKTNLTLIWAGLLAAISFCGFIIYKNIKRKQRKAELERQKEIDEKEKILKDLELSTIDAMIQGQEKERQKLASDLHDSVGATLSAAKLQFEHLIKDEIDAKMREELIKKTSTLLEDAYVEIRSMAHLKNSGVIAKNGLLPAVAKLAENASGANSLKFEVQSHGLEERIDNSLEISIFRIIQELVTNVIKHANATKGIIHLTNHEDSINIMVEDNGKGFNPNQVTKTNKGMGISSIDKRVEHLDGKLTIESEKFKGTTVIIDIPL